MKSRIAERLDSYDWSAAGASLDARGSATLDRLLTPEDCASMAGLWDEPKRFRKSVSMGPHRYGEGEYRYFAAPLPRLVRELRTRSYARLAPIANRWMETLREERRFPEAHAELLARCAAEGQTKPTPLLLRYEADGYNALHQDLYGAIAFPLQLAVFLSRPGRDYTGGEFLLVENRPRAQSVAEAFRPSQGDAIVFTTRTRPAKGSRGPTRAQVRHGVSRVRTGVRFTLGIIFHDAR